MNLQNKKRTNQKQFTEQINDIIRMTARKVRKWRTDRQATGLWLKDMVGQRGNRQTNKHWLTNGQTNKIPPD